MQRWLFLPQGPFSDPLGIAGSFSNLSQYLSMAYTSDDTCISQGA